MSHSVIKFTSNQRCCPTAAYCSSETTDKYHRKKW